MSRTASQAFGKAVADRLAALAIDIACDAPEKITTQDTKIRSLLIEEVREVLEVHAGVDWRRLVRARVERQHEAATRVQEEKLRVEAAKRSDDELRRLLERLPADAEWRHVVEEELAGRTR